MNLLVLAGLGALGLVLLAWFLHLERSGRQATVVTFILGLLVIEGSLYPGFDAPSGIFHPTFGGTSFRPYEVLIVLALVARVLARGWPERAGSAALAWMALFGWIGCQAVTGLVAGHPSDLVTFEAKIIVYLGAMALAAGVPASHYVEGRQFRGLIYFASSAAAGMTVLDATGVRIAGGLPGVPLEEFGRLGSDAASIFLAIGIIALAVALSSGRRRLSLLLACGPLLTAPFVPYQRAVLLSVAVLVLAVPVVVVGRRLWERMRVTPAEVAMAGSLIVALVAVPIAVNSWRAPTDGSAVPFADRVEDAFTSRSKQQSAEDRINQYREAWPLIQERPLFGWGLGKTYTHFQPGNDRFVHDNYTHNIAGDLLLRTGVVGLALFAIAVGLSYRDGLRAWRTLRDDRIACLVLACMLGIAGLMAKGAVESIFEKFRLAVLLGLLLGMLRSGVLSGEKAGEPTAAVAQPQEVSG